MTTTGQSEDRDPLIEARGLHVEFPVKGGSARAVDGVDLAVSKGEIIALVGESGCGKTTLAKALMGLVKPTGGEALFGGAKIPSGGSRAMRDFRKRVQLVLQDPTGALNPRRTVYEAVAEGIRIHGLDGEERRVAEALARTGLRPPEQFMGRYPHELSGGQKQRVVIAGALALDPEVIIADEPVSSLDASVRGEILALLLRLRNELDLTLLVVTHDLGLAWNIADRVAVMYLGRIVEVGTTEEVLLTPRHPYTKALISVVPESSRMAPVLLTGEAPDPARIPAGCRFNPRCPVIGSLDEQGRALCTSSDPALELHGSGQQVACHHAGAPDLPA